ncbi:Hypothetical predicted protein [Podarcis lilfordi]|uniref:Uncharacterized protein n=1 Tax=Podarcis lilfordi TaxID=74358 RepID=A0AA35PCD8_9SAUR|nr:Hypothetical predicted protein [Podarcis lilfordi]
MKLLSMCKLKHQLSSLTMRSVNFDIMLCNKVCRKLLEQCKQNQQISALLYSLSPASLLESRTIGFLLEFTGGHCIYAPFVDPGASGRHLRLRTQWCPFTALAGIIAFWSGELNQAVWDEPKLTLARTVENGR